jgi:two-component system, cell cycle response regulator
VLTAAIAAAVLARWLAGVVARQYDVAVTQLRRAEHLSVTDELTGLWNVRHLGESLRREVERASRFGRALGVLALDLDRFKEVNDRFGHRAGDAVLAEFARRIRTVVREVDLVFRQGGEEFVVLLPETDARGSATVARRVGAAIGRSPFTIIGRRPDGPASLQIPITVSIGVAVYPDHARTGTEVLDVADDALYAAKRAGRDTFVLASPRLPEQRADPNGGEIGGEMGSGMGSGMGGQIGGGTGSVDGTAPDGTRPPLAARDG